MKRYFNRVLLSFSILINTLLGGETNQSFSARNWGWKRTGRPNIVWLIDLLFFFEPNHCAESWIKWLIINKAIVSYNNIGEQIYQKQLTNKIA